MYLGMDTPGDGVQLDLAGGGLNGAYHGNPGTAFLPNGEAAASFDGVSQYLSVPSAPASLSVGTRMVFVVSPGAKVIIPDTGVKSLPATAEPEAVV